MYVIAVNEQYHAIVYSTMKKIYDRKIPQGNFCVFFFHTIVFFVFMQDNQYWEERE